MNSLVDFYNFNYSLFSPAYKEVEQALSRYCLDKPLFHINGQLINQKWSKHCLIPACLVGEIFKKSHIRLKFRCTDGEIDSYALRFQALFAWGYTKGVYTFPKILQDELMKSPPKHIPKNVLLRLPQYCLFVETHDYSIEGRNVKGFFASIDWTIDYSRVERNKLVIHYLFEGSKFMLETRTLKIPMNDDNDLFEDLEIIKDEASMGKHNVDIVNNLKEVIALLLYICSNEPEITNSLQPGALPSNPQPEYVKKHLTLRPVNKPRYWRVGYELGEKLKEAQKRSTSDGPDHVKKAHVRSGHWHGYWKGPRDGERQFFYRWLHPMLINV